MRRRKRKRRGKRGRRRKRRRKKRDIFISSFDSRHFERAFKFRKRIHVKNVSTGGIKKTKEKKKKKEKGRIETKGEVGKTRERN